VEDSFININIAQFGLQKAKERLGLKREKGTPKIFFLTLPSNENYTEELYMLFVKHFKMTF
jgi:hypothetical protein